MGRANLTFGRGLGSTARDELLREAASIEAQRELLAEQVAAKVREAVAGGSTWAEVGKRFGIAASTALRRWGG